MRFGLSAFPLGQMRASLNAPPLEVVTRIARAADELGFDFVCAQDHVVAPREWVEEGAGESWFDPFVVLSAAAAVTTRARLVTDVVILPYRSPFVVAKAGASLDAISKGRFVLGCGAGYLEAEFRILGAEFDERGAWTDDAIETIKKAWTTEWMDFDGVDATVSPKPVQQPRPPIWVGGNSMRALRRAVEHADGWTPFRGNPQTIGEMLARARGELGLDRPFDVCVPLRRGVSEGKVDTDLVRRQADELSAAGVTLCKLGLPSTALDDVLRTLETFASSVLQGR